MCLIIPLHRGLQWPWAPLGAWGASLEDQQHTGRRDEAVEAAVHLDNLHLRETLFAPLPQTVEAGNRLVEDPANKQEKTGVTEQPVGSISVPRCC